jgi:hypothetical protein
MLCSLVGLVQQCYEICVCRGVASWCSFTVLLTAASGTVTVSATETVQGRVSSSGGVVDLSASKCEAALSL